VAQAVGLSKTYKIGRKLVHALVDASLEVESGEAVAVLGPSGAGKTTLLMLMGTLDRPTGGRVVVEGRDVGGLSESELAGLRARRLGFVFQSYNLIQGLTALENVELPLRFSGGSSRGTSAGPAEWLRRLGLEGRLDHYPLELSGGEQQRVAIARALVNEPVVVFMDEPTGNLDSRTTARLLDLLRDLRAYSPTAFVIATHDEQVAAYADRVVSIEDGVVRDD